MTPSLLDLFGFVSVLLRGLCLAGEVVVAGSACFLFVVPGEGAAGRRFALMRDDAWAWMQRAAAVTLAAVAAAAIVNAVVLMQSTGLEWRDVAGAHFATGAGLECALLAAILALARASRRPRASHESAEDRDERLRARRHGARFADALSASLGGPVGDLLASPEYQANSGPSSAAHEPSQAPVAAERSTASTLSRASVPATQANGDARPQTSRPGASREMGAAVAAAISRHVAVAADTTSSRATAALLALAVLCASAAASHAAARPDGRTLALAATLLHHVGAAVWIGALPAFYAALSPRHAPALSAYVAQRFSAVATAGVAMLVAGALLLAIQYVGSADSLYGTSYGMMVVTKAVLLCLLLAIGFANRRLSRRAAGDPGALPRLARFVEVELCLGLAAVMLAASLASAPPGADLAGLGEQVSLAEIGERLAPRTPRLASPDASSLAIAARQARFDQEARAAGRSGASVAYVPGSGEPPPRNAQDIAWSEYNHHWAGIVVLLVGIVTFADWTGRGGWSRVARHWPLLFIVLAAFIALRADPEVWPLGPTGLIASLRDPEVVQHRVFALLIAVLGVFEWRVRNGRFASLRPALLFPALTITGAILLLTHTHAIGNVKEEALIEITHLPLAVLGLAAGAARWLEIRAENGGTTGERRAAGLTWRIAFILVGVLLLGYQEA